MARGKADIQNTSIRIFLQEFGRKYDEKRGLKPYNKAKDQVEILEFFDYQCCYCGDPLGEGGQKPHDDHLIGLNRESLGLHAWGNIVPACNTCNGRKQAKDWRDFLASAGGKEVAARHKKIKAFVKHYDYDPPFDLKTAANDLYEEIGKIAMALIDTKVERTAGESG